MKTKIAVFTLSLGLLLGCGKQQEGTTTLEDLKSQQKEQSNSDVKSVSYTDSINNLSSKISGIKTAQDEKRQLINALNKKKDSVNTLFIQVQKSLDQVNKEKIAPGIEGVNIKLSELKGQRENAIEQLDLQKQEIVLAEKKIGLLKEEKTIYDSQHKALWNRGAEPVAFKVVDSLLAGLTSKISEQSLRVKNLNSTITDINEQIISIDEQRNSLSSKIRNNYTAKQIFDDYSKEEQKRLENQLLVIETNLKTLVEQDDSLNSLLAKESSKKYDFEGSLNASEKAAQEKTNMLLSKELKESENKSNNKKNMAFIIIGLLAIVFLMFFILGKIKRNQSKN